MSGSDEALGQRLDRYLAALRAAGYRARLSQPGLSPESVRAALVEANYGPREEVVEFFTWAQYPEPAGDFDLFEYYSSPFSLREAIKVGAFYRQSWFEDWPEHGLDPAAMLQTAEGESFPGAEQVDMASWLPLTMGVDTMDLLVVDTSDHPTHGGSVWLTEKHGYVRSYDSLADAIEAATRCVESGAWVIEDEIFITWPGRHTAFRFAEVGPGLRDSDPMS